MYDMTEKIEFQCAEGCFPPLNSILYSKQIAIQEKLTIPEGKPDIEQLIEVYARAHIDNCKLIKTPLGKKLIVEGHLHQKVIYVADVSCQSVHAAHFDVPFCTFIKLPSSCSSSGYIPSLKAPNTLIEYLCAKKLGPREISKCTILLIWFCMTPRPKFKPSSCCNYVINPSGGGKLGWVDEEEDCSVFTSSESGIVCARAFE